MNSTDVADVNELSEPEFTDHPDSVGIFIMFPGA